ncbi:hypothetical protein [Desulfosporosinus shakirovi]|uniref:hypothetical protein n=1 Tax=Desulfosporosinus shakirovi TaxID=2885154 RepID=UPI001E587D1A|nr:hypothetical protein [Desulfosporosinus sp. SRJS8]MCB8815314.1 hypothetical protein [Desulfosporosinus sp. SRJS8]
MNSLRQFYLKLKLLNTKKYYENSKGFSHTEGGTEDGGSAVRPMQSNLSIYELTIEFEQNEDGRYAGSIEQIPAIVADGETLEELRMELVYHLFEYAKDYYADFNRYFNSPNRHSHAYYILRVLLEDNLESVSGMLHA